MMNGEKTKVLQVVPLSGGKPKELLRLEESRSYGIAIEWSADGKHICFTRPQSDEDETQMGLWRIAADGGEPEELNLIMFNYQDLIAHPDGKRLVFSTVMC